MRQLGAFITGGYRQPFYARKTILLRGTIERAQADVCGLGQFIFYINGRKVGDHELDPGWTNYRKYAQYVSFDVTELLASGENILAAEVGNGWFIKDDTHYTFRLPEFMGANPNPYRPFADSLVLALRLKVEYADGSTEEITADESFRVAPASTVMSNVYGSETYDLRLEQPGWNDLGFDDRHWSHGVIIPEDTLEIGTLLQQTQPPVKVIRRYSGNLLHKVGNRSIYDFGQNMSGMLDFMLSGPAGAVVRFYPAEKLRGDGDVDQVAKGWTTVDSCITAILGDAEEPQHFRMKFTYFAGRYVAVEQSSDEVEILNLAAEAITSAWNRHGTFCCDDERYLQIYDLVEKAVEANMVSVHTDCPTIERFAWQEPNHLMAPAILFMKDGRKLWEKFLLDMRMEQHGPQDTFRDYEGKQFPAGDGLIPSQCPCYIPNVFPVPGMGSFYDIIGWGSALILGARWHYRFYGDIQIIRDNYDAGIHYLNYLKSKLTPEGFINHGLGDWGNPSGEFARENVETAFLYADTVALMEFADLLGKHEESAELAAFAATIKQNYNERLLVRNEKTGLWCYRVYEHPETLLMTQAAEAMPLYFDLVPEEAMTDVQTTLFALMKEQNAFVCGEIDMPYVIQTAHRCGWDDLIAEFILHREHPSYYAFVLDGETTLGEYWEHNPRSHCHDMMGHITEWYYNGIAGIECLAPGFSKVRLRPWLPSSMHQFSCSYESASGRITVSVEETESEILLRYAVAEEMICEVDIDRLSERGKPVLVSVIYE